ncbi:MAG: hypothetical protein R3B83_14030 [Nitrospirales bacterium]|nr:hypothetical protein [Nitrospirales bacterium]
MPVNWLQWFSQSWVQISILLLIGLQAFFSNMTLSLFGETEGLYANVTHHMMAGGDYFSITMPEGPYFNKPPLFFGSRQHWFMDLDGVKPPFAYRPPSPVWEQ